MQQGRFLKTLFFASSFRFVGVTANIADCRSVDKGLPAGRQVQLPYEPQMLFVAYR